MCQGWQILTNNFGVLNAYQLTERRLTNKQSAG